MLWRFTLSLLFLFLLLPSGSFGGALSPTLLEEAQQQEAALIHAKQWNEKTPDELKEEAARLKGDLAGIEKRRQELQGRTGLNQDQYREKETLDRLTYRKEWEMSVIKKLLEEHIHKEEP